MTRKAAVVCSPGIGDALIFSIASHHLSKQGFSVTTFHPHLADFGRWLDPESHCRPLVDQNELLSFDLILLQHDNTPLAYSLTALRTEGAPLSIFYPTYNPAKHPPLLKNFDHPFDQEQTMVANVCTGLAKLFGGTVTKKNSLTPPPELIHKKYPNRIAIHPTSGASWRNWPRKQFLAIAAQLKKQNLDPRFIVSPKEHPEWPHAPLLPSLEEFASFLYESGAFLGNNSGPGHLASYLSIPHLILAHQERHMKLWRPGWMRGSCLLPPTWVPNWKGFRWREQHWNYFITKRRVLNNLERLLQS